jgi:hypothetical protein
MTERDSTQVGSFNGHHSEADVKWIASADLGSNLDDSRKNVALVQLAKSELALRTKQVPSFQCLYLSNMTHFRCSTTTVSNKTLITSH